MPPNRKRKAAVRFERESGQCRLKHKKASDGIADLYSGLNLNQYVVASPCRTICTVCGFVALS
ncbi:hypothetical protein [Neisseria meningitidis]|uniref:hypothetical protein n=1 Tax=Neisseria meningitidis TaxID=487 RepID=UPI0003A74086|nr:hypothetical protein [Neisseria meningitidis]